MALIDRMRERMRGQRPVGAAEDMQRGMRPPAEVTGGGPVMPSYPGMAPLEDPQRGGRYGLQHNGMSEEQLANLGNSRTPEELDAFTLRYTADVYDASEMLPWLRTFLGRVVSLHCSSEYVTRRFAEDLAALEALYGGESHAVP